MGELKVNALEFIELRGQQAKPYIEDLARLRMKVFFEWPYLYEGTFEYEFRYLETYFQSKNSFVCIARDGDKVVGATTAVWLPDADEEMKKPFIEKNFRLENFCYYGESVLLAEYRGQGVGVEFMKRREDFAREFDSVDTCAFCAVVRPDNHPLRPADYVPLDEFWRKRGFIKQPEMVAEYSWKDRGEENETRKQLQFWFKRIR